MVYPSTEQPPLNGKKSKKKLLNSKTKNLQTIEP